MWDDPEAAGWVLTVAALLVASWVLFRRRDRAPKPAGLSASASAPAPPQRPAAQRPAEHSTVRAPVAPACPARVPVTRPFRSVQRLLAWAARAGSELAKREAEAARPLDGDLDGEKAFDRQRDLAQKRAAASEGVLPDTANDDAAAAGNDEDTDADADTSTDTDDDAIEDECRREATHAAEHDLLCAAGTPLMKAPVSLAPDTGAGTGHPRLLVCHDMMGGYLGDRLTQGRFSVPGCSGCEGEGEGEGEGEDRPAKKRHDKHDSSAYRLYHWEMIDTFVYFSHELVTVPPAVWINAAHAHGTRVLGTFISEWDRGSRQMEAVLRSPSRAEAVADALARLAASRGFEGWLINIENAVPKERIPTLLHFVRDLTLRTKQLVPGGHGHVLWYDAVTTQGNLCWQDRLSPLNKPFFDACDGIFVNYTWNVEACATSAAAAGHARLRDVYMGVDVFGRGTLGGGGMRCDQALKAARRAGLSAALFAPGWVLEHLDEDEDEDGEGDGRAGATWGANAATEASTSDLGTPAAVAALRHRREDEVMLRAAGRQRAADSMRDARFEARNLSFWAPIARAWEAGRGAALASTPSTQMAGNSGSQVSAAPQPPPCNRYFRSTFCGGSGEHGFWRCGQMLCDGRWYCLSEQTPLPLSLLQAAAPATKTFARDVTTAATASATAVPAGSAGGGKTAAALAVRLRLEQLVEAKRQELSAARGCDLGTAGITDVERTQLAACALRDVAAAAGASAAAGGKAPAGLTERGMHGPPGGTPDKSGTSASSHPSRVATVATVAIGAALDNSRSATFDGGCSLRLQGVLARPGSSPAPGSSGSVAASRLSLPAFSFPSSQQTLRVPPPRRRALAKARAPGSDLLLPRDGGGGVEVSVTFRVAERCELCVYLLLHDGRTIILRNVPPRQDDVHVACGDDRRRGNNDDSERVLLGPSPLVGASNQRSADLTDAAAPDRQRGAQAGPRLFFAPSHEQQSQPRADSAGNSISTDAESGTPTPTGTETQRRIQQLRQRNVPFDRIAALLAAETSQARSNTHAEHESASSDGVVDATALPAHSRIPWTTRLYCIGAVDIGGGGRIVEVGFVCVLKNDGGQQGQDRTTARSAGPELCAYRAWVGDIAVAPFSSYRFEAGRGHSVHAPLVAAPAAATRLRWRPPRCVSLQCTRLLWSECPDTGTDLLSFALHWSFDAHGTATGAPRVSAMRCAGVVAVDVWLVVISASGTPCAGAVDDGTCSGPTRRNFWIGRARVPCFCIERLRLPAVERASSVNVALQPIGFLGQHESLSETTCATIQLTH